MEGKYNFEAAIFWSVKKYLSQKNRNIILKQKYPLILKPAPFFSIVIPAYNKAKFLSRAIQSVLDQQFNSWELLVVDDDSLDNTRDVVSSFNDSRIHYIYQSNSERSAARNNGINHAKGAYICFLDADDFYLNNHLNVLHLEIEKENFKVAFYYTGIVIEDQSGLKNLEMKNSEGEHPVSFAFNNILQCNAACIHREILMDERFDERFTHWEEMHLWLRILLKYPFVRIQDHTAVKNESQNRNSYNKPKRISLSRIDNNISCINDFFLNYGKASEKYISKQSIRDYIHRKLTQYAHVAIQNRQFKETCFLFYRIIANKPLYMMDPKFTRLVFATGLRFMTF